MKNIILIGPPGAGKGTQGSILSSYYGIPTISTGQILRDEVRLESTLGLEIKKIIEAGFLVNDEKMILLIKKRLEQDDSKNGFILDGFPRTLSQAQIFTESKIKITTVLSFKLDDGVIIDRLSGRRVHEASGRTYHILYNKPLQADRDDLTGEPLVLRKDDQIDNIKKRLTIYHEMTRPVIEFYQKKAHDQELHYYELDANLELNELTKALFKMLS